MSGGRAGARAEGPGERRGSPRGRRRREEPIRLTLLGGFSVHVGEVERRLPGGTRRLLARIALSPRGVSRARAAADLYPLIDSARAAHTLRTALSRLRAALPGAVGAERALLRLREGVRVDALDLERIALALADGTRTTVDDLDLDRFSDELLPGWDDEWVALHRDALASSCLDALEEAGRLLAGERRWTRARAAVARARAADRLRESTARALVELDWRRGNRALAVTEYLTYHEQLVSAVGLVPSPELTGLVARLRDEGRPRPERGPTGR